MGGIYKALLHVDRDSLKHRQKNILHSTFTFQHSKFPTLHLLLNNTLKIMYRHI
jgi:hypothetical protein